jgi:hypothetical protein
MTIRKYTATFFIFFMVFFEINAQNNDGKTEISSSIISKSFGSFLLPNDWVELTRYSKNGKYFYSHQSESNSSSMTNISIEIGRNPYALEDHMTFRYAILRQLLMQAGRVGDSQVDGTGDFTQHNDPLYIFTIEDEENHISTIQFYIIGNKKHILIHLTDFHNKNITNAKEVARLMADSFIWAE